MDRDLQAIIRANLEIALRTLQELSDAILVVTTTRELDELLGRMRALAAGMVAATGDVRDPYFLVVTVSGARALQRLLREAHLFSDPQSDTSRALAEIRDAIEAGWDIE